MKTPSPTWPDKLETPEDYDTFVKNVAWPFLRAKAVEVADHVKELQDYIVKGGDDRKELEKLTGKIKEVTEFASPGAPDYEKWQKLMEIEDGL